MESYCTTRLMQASLALTLLLCIISAAHAQSSQRLNGVVTDPFGSLIPNAVITLFVPARILKASTDQEGRFAFANLPPGRYEIEASAPGFKTTTLEVVSAPNSDAEPLPIRLAVASTGDCSSGETGSVSYQQPDDGGSKLAVKVLDSDGRALSNATLSVAGAPATARQFPQRTNHKGEFLLGGIEPGRYLLIVSRAGYHDSTTLRFWITRENQTTVVVHMIKHGEIVVCE